MIKQIFASVLIFVALLIGVLSEKQDSLNGEYSEILHYLANQKSVNENLTETIREKLEPISKLVDTVEQLKAQQEGLEGKLQLLLEVTKLGFGELLTTAVRQGNVDQIHLLLKAGAPIEYEDSKKNRPILIATENSKDALIQLLIENHADVNVHGEYYYTPLHWTSYNGCLKCAKILLENGANVDSRDNWSDTPLIKASKYGYTELVELFLNNGADVNATQEESFTGLHMAAREGQVGVVKLLLEHGAKPQLKNKYDDTPLDLATRNQHEEIIALLKNKLSSSESERQPEKDKS